MSVPRPQGWKYQEPQYWDSYLPQTDDFDDAQGYIDALAAGAEDTSDPHGRYWDEIGQVWRGGRRTEREIALSKYDSGRYMDPNNSFNKGPYSLMRLQNRIGFDPEEARMAYGAHDEFGNPLLDPAILAMIEDQLGITENERPPDNYGSGGERPGGRDRVGRDPREGNGDLPDAARYGQWWNNGSDPSPTSPRAGGGGGMSSGPLRTTPGDPYDGPRMVYMNGQWVPSRTASDFTPPPGTVNESLASYTYPNVPDEVQDAMWQRYGVPLQGMTDAILRKEQGTPGAEPPATGSERAPDPPSWMDMLARIGNQSTIDPRYPDFVLLGNPKWGPKPINGLGEY